MIDLKSKILNIAAGVLIGVLLCVSLYKIPQAVGADWEKSLPFTPQQLAIIKQVKLALSTYQVDGDKKGKVDDTKMYYGALKGLVESLEDPYTRFVEPKALEEENMEMEGEYGGLGIYMASRDGRTIVIAPIEDTPADRAGIKPLDEIIKVDEKNVMGMESDEVVKMLRGPAGKPVTIQIRRKNVDKLIPVKIVREVIKIKTVRMEMLGDGIAYIKLNHFNLKTDGEVRAAIKKATEKKAIVGMKTFGKGSVQTLFNLPDGSGIYVTIARYHTPSGFVLDHKGLQPDIKVEGEPKKDKKEDKQLQKALGVLRQKIKEKK